MTGGKEGRNSKAAVPIWPDLKEKRELRLGSEALRELAPQPSQLHPHLKAELPPQGGDPRSPTAWASRVPGGVAWVPGGPAPAPPGAVYSPTKAGLPAPRTPAGSGELTFPG